MEQKSKINQRKSKRSIIIDYDQRRVRNLQIVKEPLIASSHMYHNNNSFQRYPKVIKQNKLSKT